MSKPRRCLQLLTLALPLAATACGGASEKPSIVLDRAIGGIALNEKRAEVERRLGRGEVIRTQDQRSPEPRAHAEFVRYPNAGLEVVYVSRDSTTASRERGLAIIVLTTSPLYRTPQGVHVGSSAAEVESIPGVKCDRGRYPSECQHGYSSLNRPGTSFQLRGTQVWRIAIAFGH